MTEQLAFDFAAAYKADLILYLANALRRAISTMRYEAPARDDIPPGWDSLVDEALAYANADDALAGRDEMRRILLARESATRKHVEDLENRVHSAAWQLRHGEDAAAILATLEGHVL